MTRKSKREIERQLDDLDTDGVIDDSPIFLVSDPIMRGSRELPEVEPDEADIAVTKEYANRRPRIAWWSRIPCLIAIGTVVILAYRDVAWCWENMSEEVLERELELLRVRGDPIPLFLQE